MSGKDEKTKEFWEQSAEDLLKTDDEIFKAQVERYFKRDFINSLYDEKFMVRAIESAITTITNLKIKELDIRVSSLESANEFSFASLALNLALSSACGYAVGFLAKKLITKVLGHRLVLLNIIDRGGVEISSISQDNMTALMKKAGYSKKAIENGRAFKKIAGITNNRKVNLAPGSLESLLIEHFPDITNSRTDEFIQALEGGIPKGMNISKIKSPEINSYFNTQQTNLVEKMRRLELSHADYEFLIKASFSKFNGFVKRGYIEAIKNAVDFDRTIDNKTNFSISDESVVMAQPYILTAITSSFGVLPEKILPPEKSEFSSTGTSTIFFTKALPERVATSSQYRDLLFEMTKYILVPIDNNGAPLSFFDHYKEDKHATTVALVRYLNKIREQKELQDLKRWTREGIDIFKKIKSTNYNLAFPLF